MNVPEKNVVVTLRLVYPVPADANDRVTIYGTADIAKCVDVDMVNDPAMFLMDSEIDVLSVEWQ